MFIYIVFLLINYLLCSFIVKRQIKKNISLFYALHKKQVDNILHDKEEDDLIEKI